MLVTELGIVIEAREEQLLNALVPIPVIELGMVIEAREEQLLNTLLPMLVTPFPILTESIMLVHAVTGFVASYVPLFPIMSEGNDIAPSVTLNVTVYVAG